MCSSTGEGYQSTVTFLNLMYSIYNNVGIWIICLTVYSDVARAIT